MKVSTVSLETAGRLQIFSQAITKSVVPGTRLHKKSDVFYALIFLCAIVERCDLPAEAAASTEGSGCCCAVRFEGVGCSPDLGACRQIGRGLLVPDGDWEGCW